MEWLRKQTEEEVLNHLFANEDFDRYYRQTLLAVKNNTLSPRTGLRQLTDGPHHNYNACWLPDGGIATCRDSVARPEKPLIGGDRPDTAPPAPARLPRR